LVVFDLSKKDIKFTVNMDLTTDYSQYRGYIHGAPTVVDIDDDGKLDIIVATAAGYIYAYDHTGVLKKGFPSQVVDEVQGQVAAADVNNDGKLELIIADSNSNVLCLKATGEELWESRISGFPTKGVAIGDINGDGILDVIIASDNGHIWALRGDTGEVISKFPIKLGGRVMAPINLIRLDSEAKNAITNESSLIHIVVPSLDGMINIINSEGFVDKIDLGENSLSMVLVDDVTGDGKLDFIVATMNGNIYCLGTTTPYHPLRVSKSRTERRNSIVFKEDYLAVFFTKDTRSYRDVTGDTITVQFEIVDKRPVVLQHIYNISISVGRTKLFSELYKKPGVYTELVTIPNRRMYASLLIEMTNEHKEYFHDSFTLSFNLQFYKTMKWILIIPFACMSFILLFVKDLKTPLPI